MLPAILQGPASPVVAPRLLRGRYAVADDMRGELLNKRV
jgi:hypothetical protein